MPKRNEHQHTNSGKLRSPSNTAEFSVVVFVCPLERNPGRIFNLMESSPIFHIVGVDATPGNILSAQLSAAPLLTQLLLRAGLPVDVSASCLWTAGHAPVVAGAAKNSLCQVDDATMQQLILRVAAVEESTAEEGDDVPRYSLNVPFSTSLHWWLAANSQPPNGTPTSTTSSSATLQAEEATTATTTATRLPIAMARRPLVVLCPHDMVYDRVTEYLAAHDSNSMSWGAAAVLVVSIGTSAAAAEGAAGEGASRLLSLYTQLVSMLLPAASSAGPMGCSAAEWLVRAEKSLMSFGSLRSVEVLCSAYLI